MSVTYNSTPSAPLVGSHFYPPAKALLAELPNGAPLLLRPEPENPYDDHAVAVYADLDAPECLAALDAIYPSLASTGKDVDELRAQRYIQVGHIARVIAADWHEPIAAAIAAQNEASPYDESVYWGCKLGFNAQGKYIVTWELP